MTSIILPVKPKYSQAIFNGKKTFEIRRRIPKKEVFAIFIYETAPTSKVVGYAEVNRTHKLEIEALWELTKEGNLLTKQEFLDYLKGLDYGYAFELGKVVKFNNPIELENAPQGFVYCKSIGFKGDK